MATSRHRWDDVCDVVVVGSGAAGATVAVNLAEAGVDVLLLEEGPDVRPSELTANVWRTAKRVFRDGGSFFLRGPTFIPALQGRAVGGSTLINSAICWPLPEHVHADWVHRDPALGAALPYLRLSEHARIIEADLRIAPTPAEVLGGNNERVRDGAMALGWRGHAIRRNVSGCQATALCLQGCPSEAKQSMAVSYVPRAVRAGARLWPDTRVLRVLLQGTGAHGVEAERRVEGSRAPARLRIEARRGVVLAASCIQTPVLLQASGLGRRGPVGDHLACHPGLGVAVSFDPQGPEVNLWHGATQGFEVDEFAHDRIKIEAVSLPPELLALRLPGMGPRLLRTLGHARHIGVWGAQVRAEAEGKVRRGWTGKPVAHLTLGARDVDRLRRGFRISAEIAFAAGAHSILPGIHGLPEELFGMDELDRHLSAFRDSSQVNLIATHLFGTARMGSDPRTSVVDPQFRVHGIDGLWIADSSVFPSNLGVNPQFSIMTLARDAAMRVLDAPASSRPVR